MTRNKVTRGLDLQPDGLSAWLAGHCQPTVVTEKDSSKDLCFKENNFTSSALMLSKF